MSGYQTTDGGLDRTKLDMALQELEAGTLDPVERDEMMALVTRSPAAQRVYLEFFEISAMLGAEAATYAEHGNLPKIVSFEPPRRLTGRSLLAAAALVTLGAVLAALIHNALPGVSEMKLAATADTHWSVQGELRDSGGHKATVREGSTVWVESGTVELRLESGAAMVMQGPAQVSFPKLTQPVLRSGWLWLDSGASHETFEVHTPDLRIRNHGTRFGVRVPAGEPTEVHLIKGKLEVTVEFPRKTKFELVPEQQGLAFPAQAKPSTVTLARDPFPEIAELLAAPANYSPTVRGQNPVGYWRLDDISDGRLHNEVEGESNGEIQPGFSSATGGPGPTDGFLGFAPENRAARLPGTPGDSLLRLGSTPRHDGLLFQATFDGPGALNRQQPKVSMNESAWVAAPSFQADGEITPGVGSATLPFRPVDGVVYLLETALRNLSGSAGISNWVAFGFAKGQSTGTGSIDRFVNGMVTGRAWMLFRGNESEFENTALLAGTSDPEVWRILTGDSGDGIDMRIVLDTTKGSGNWTATWFAKRPGDRDYVKVRDTRRLPNEAIRSVGIAVSGEGTRARIAGFSLRAKPVVKDPSTHGLVNGPARINRRAGAVSCWLRRVAGKGRAEVLWSARENAVDDAIYSWLEADGRVGLFIENGRYDVLMTSEETLADGRWHHLTASWSPNTVDLYLDGRRVAWERESRDLLQGSLPELRVGGSPQDSGPALFTGDIDEFAVWDRALTAIEVRQQYRSAQEGGSETVR